MREIEPKDLAKVFSVANRSIIGSNLVAIADSIGNWHKTLKGIKGDKVTRIAHECKTNRSNIIRLINLSKKDSYIKDLVINRELSFAYLSDMLSKQCDSQKMMLSLTTRLGVTPPEKMKKSASVQEGEKDLERILNGEEIKLSSATEDRPKRRTSRRKPHFRLEQEEFDIPVPDIEAAKPINFDKIKDPQQIITVMKRRVTYLENENFDLKSDLKLLKAKYEALKK